MASKMTRLGGMAFVASLLLGWPVARADLYTDRVMSLEWKVDSADTIYTATLVAKDESGLRFRPTGMLKPRHGSVTFPHDAVKRCHLIGDRWPVSSRWMFFVRGRARTARIFAAVNLSYLDGAYRLAAVTMRGQGNARLLLQESEVIEFVRQRVAVNHQLPTHCDRDMSDLLCVLPAGSWEFPWVALVGADLVAIDVDYFDGPIGQLRDQDTLLTAMVVPRGVSLVDEKAHVRLEQFPRTRNRFRAADILPYFRRSVIPQQDAEIVGGWRYETKDMLVDVKLHPEHTMICRTRALHAKEDEKKQPVYGVGVWYRRGEEVRLVRTQTFDGPAYHDLETWNEKLFTDHIREVSPDRIMFASGAAWRRTSEKLEMFRHVNEHLRFRVSD